MTQHETALKWLNRKKYDLHRSIHSWQIRAQVTNICDNYGRNPIDAIQSEIATIEFIINQLTTNPI